MVDLKIGEWQPLGEVFAALTERLMTNDPEFVLRNFDCKYINVRVDMRVGNAVITPGNKVPYGWVMEWSDGQIKFMSGAISPGKDWVPVYK